MQLGLVLNRADRERKRRLFMLFSRRFDPWYGGRTFDVNKVGSVEAVVIAGLVTVRDRPLFCIVFLLFKQGFISAALVTNLFFVNKGSKFLGEVGLLVCQILENRFCPHSGHSVKTRIGSLSFIS
jgi:hypothetical protein